MQHRQAKDPITRVTEPIVVGSSVIGLKFKGGVVLASDTLLSYGGTLSKNALIENTRTSTESRRSLTTWR